MNIFTAPGERRPVASLLRAGQAEETRKILVDTRLAHGQKENTLVTRFNVKQPALSLYKVLPPWSQITPRPCAEHRHLLSSTLVSRACV